MRQNGAYGARNAVVGRATRGARVRYAADGRAAPAPPMARYAALSRNGALRQRTYLRHGASFDASRHGAKRKRRLCAQCAGCCALRSALRSAFDCAGRTADARAARTESACATRNAPRTSTACARRTAFAAAARTAFATAQNCAWRCAQRSAQRSPAQSAQQTARHRTPSRGAVARAKDLSHMRHGRIECITLAQRAVGAGAPSATPVE